MANEMMERVARAIWAERVRAAKEHGIELEAWGEGPFFIKAAEGQSVALMNNIMGEARVAIEAIRKPTESMMDAACAIGPDTNRGEFDYENATNVWQAMIDAALSD